MNSNRRAKTLGDSLIGPRSVARIGQCQLIEEVSDMVSKLTWALDLGRMPTLVDPTQSRVGKQIVELLGYRGRCHDDG